MEIKISIIIASYNSEGVIGRALNSVLNQNFSTWECIVVDGGSKDRTIEIVSRYSANDSRFSFTSEPDNGIYNALNKGLKKAKGEWIYVLGSDDELLPNGLLSLLNGDDGESDCIYGDVFLRDNLGKISLFKSKPCNKLRTAMCCSHQGIIIKRAVMIDLNGFDEQFKISADYELLIRAYLRGYNFKQLKGTTVCYFSSDSGVSSKLDLYSAKEQYRIYSKNRTVTFPIVPVIFNFAKRLMRQYIYDPKK